MNDETARLTYTELAKKLRVQPCTVRAWQTQGLPYIPCGRLKFYDFTVVEAWLRERDSAKQAAKKGRLQQENSAA
jgi:phage terminase Nu1 subunit (DNA packaging protein)